MLAAILVRNAPQIVDVARLSAADKLHAWYDDQRNADKRIAFTSVLRQHAVENSERVADEILSELHLAVTSQPER